MLTGTELVDLGGGISIDQHIAQQIGGATKLASLELAVEESPSTVSSGLSYLGAVQPVPPEADPQKVFHRLFDGSSLARYLRAPPHHQFSLPYFCASAPLRLCAQLRISDRARRLRPERTGNYDP